VNALTIIFSISSSLSRITFQQNLSQGIPPTQSLHAILGATDESVAMQPRPNPLQCNHNATKSIGTKS
jgi:hypothetical protein